jgi:formylglycine-generating enzyme
MAKDVNVRYKSASAARQDLTAWSARMEDSRGRSTKPPSDDATLPLDQIRGAQAPRSQSPRPQSPRSASPGSASPGSASSRPARPTSQRRAPAPLAPQQPRERAPLVEPDQQQEPDYRDQPAGRQPQGRTRPLPRWAWWAGAGAALVLIAAAMILPALLGYPGFTLVVRDAPPGSDVYIDGVRRGVPSSNGDIRVVGLEAGISREVRVACEGYEDSKHSVNGENGIEKVISWNRKEKSVLKEIDYNGPMILIPAGKFTMGSNDYPYESPAHEVSLPDYYIDQFEVTNRQYKEFCQSQKRPCPTNPWWDEQYFINNPDSPVVGVSWNDAVAYAESVGKRLPTEEEWEKAASWDPSKNEKRKWPWGNNAEQGRANIGTGRPTPRNQFPGDVSWYGVRDMAGNVSEWVQDFYTGYKDNKSPDPEFGNKNRVSRGINFKDGMTLEDARTTARFYQPPTFNAQEKQDRSWLIGFRCVVSANDVKLQEYLRKRGPGQ